MSGSATPAAVVLIITAASALLLASSYIVRREIDASSDEPPQAPDWTDMIDKALATARNLVLPSPAADMLPSGALLAMLRQGEALRLSRYRLGDGGWTIGYGRYYPDGGQLPPESIDRETAEAWFAEDVEARAARWVRAYVAVPLQQHQFDALVHMAYNLKPSSFRTIADAVNAGVDPEAAALRYIRAGTNLEKGLRNRRAREVALWREGTYA